MQRFLVTCQFIGSNFHGWARQRTLAASGTVQGTIEHALRALTSRTDTYGAGRTDAGVHAAGMPFHFDQLWYPQKRRSDESAPSALTGSPTPSLSPKPSLEPRRLVAALNQRLKRTGVSIVSARPVPGFFHARFLAEERSYLYRIRCPRPGRKRQASMLPRVNLFEVDRSWFVRDALDTDAMQAAADYFPGVHDFSSFRASGCQAASARRTMREVQVERISYDAQRDWQFPLVEEAQDEVRIRVSARAFLYNQVRIMVGVLVDVGRGKLRPEFVREALEARDRAFVRSAPAPACGLYFLSAKYPDWALGDAPIPDDVDQEALKRYMVVPP